MLNVRVCTSRKVRLHTTLLDYSPSHPTVSLQHINDRHQSASEQLHSHCIDCNSGTAQGVLVGACLNPYLNSFSSVIFSLAADEGLCGRNVRPASFNLCYIRESSLKATTDS